MWIVGTVILLVVGYGIIAFNRGRITERHFQDVVPLDIPWDYPRIEPPQELADYLLGAKQPWQFADANWSPDFPTSAQDALRLYTNESGDARIDGVLGITTYTIDELLKVTGPLAVPDYNVTIASGETTLKVLQLTRAASAPGADRKAFLPAFADRLLASLLALPPRKWGDLLGAANAFSKGKLLLAWFRNPADQAFVARSGFDGAVRQVKCQVRSVSGFSAHADEPELLDWLAGFAAGKRAGAPGFPKQVFLVHGDPGPQAALLPKVAALGFDVRVPRWHETVTLD